MAPRSRGGARMVNDFVRRSRVVLALALLLAPLPSCTAKGDGGGAPQASASDGSPRAGSARPPSASARPAALRASEQRRASREVTEADLSSRGLGTRRAAARALARIADARSAELLAKSLADEDPEVVAWSAYGLGWTCREHDVKTTRALSVRAASLLVAAHTKRAPNAGAPSALGDPLAAIAGALARCATSEAEATLRAWVGAESALAEPAAVSLGAIATRTGRLDDASLVALLDAAGRAKDPVAAALYPFARLTALGAPVRARLFEVARARLGAPGPARAFAVRALGAAGEAAVSELARLVESGQFSAGERADAARALGRLGASGQSALARAFERLLTGGALEPAALGSAHFAVLLAALDALTPPLGSGAPALARLAELGVPEAPAGTRRRVVALRCRAAGLLAGRGTLSAKLVACDPDPKGRSARLALLRVLDRGPLQGARWQRYRELLEGDDPLVRERALELLPAHAEVRETPELLARALRAKTPGDVATAALLIAKHPARASSSPADPDAPTALSPDASIVHALGSALETWSKSPSIEVRAMLADAAAALELLGAKPRLELDCKSSHPTLRLHAQKALRRLGQRDRLCDAFEPDATPPDELARALSRKTRLDFDTDAGALSLELDPTLAPIAATRLTELAREGFFDGVVVHRVVPGFVVQLGDREGDGYGGADRPPLRCETSPMPFEPGAVGIALGGRDTGSSQFFVTLGRHPHLDGEYALVGHAGAGWDLLVEGDVVRKVRVRD